MAHGAVIPPSPQNETILSYKPGSKERQELTQELAQLKEPFQIPLVVGQKKVFDRPTRQAHSPHDHKKIVAEVAEATAKDVESAISDCLKSRHDWARLPFEHRASVFLKAADLLSTKYRQKVNSATIECQSKTCFQAEIDAVVELIDFLRFNVYFAQQIYEQQPLRSPFGQWNRSEARGLEGFVFAVGPFNFTSISVNLATSPALMGCSVLWKPSIHALPASYLCLQMLEEAGLPPGVINMVSGDDAMIGKTALAHSELSGVHFTGSVPVFNYLWQEVGNKINHYRNYPRIVGETGGKDFVFAHCSADVDCLVTALLRGAFEYQGQKCSAASRAFIPRSIWGEVKEKLLQQTGTIKMGDPKDFKNFMSAVINRPSFDKIKGFIERAKQASDASVLCGGHCDDSTGYFIQPTIIEAKTPHYETMVQELFGPVLSVFVYEDDKLEETLKICDEATPYALTGAIFAQDKHVVHKLSEALEYSAGNFYINDKPTGAVVGQQPFGGARKSGTNDKAGSIVNLFRWTSFRTVKENFLNIDNYSYPHMD